MANRPSSFHAPKRLTGGGIPSVHSPGIRAEKSTPIRHDDVRTGTRELAPELLAPGEAELPRGEGFVKPAALQVAAKGRPVSGASAVEKEEQENWPAHTKCNPRQPHAASG